MKLLEKLSQEDLNQFHHYRNWIDGYVSNNEVDVKHILRFWDKEKQDLFDLFGQKLIIEKDFEYATSEEELNSLMEALCYEKNYRRYDKLNFNCCSKFVDKLQQAVRYNDFFWPRRNEIGALFSASSLAKNCYNGPSFKITYLDKEEKEATFQCQKGAKAIKMIRKLAEILEVDGVDDFINSHSQVLTQGVIKGTLCLSIHPLDYATMSDNAENWNSCMRWTTGDGAGEYCQGTVEMMNSPYVIVAYIKSNKHKFELGSNFSWNSKKWRTLLIVNRDLICSIKAYPYRSDMLTDLCVDEVKRLAEANWGITYSETKKIHYDDSDTKHYGNWYSESCFNLKNDTPIYVNINTDDCHMYCDMGCADVHHLAIETSIFDKDEDCCYIDCNYSGISECVCCGETYDVDSESVLCEDCLQVHYCPVCGDRVSLNNDYYVEHNYQYYHSECYYDSCVEDNISEESVLESELTYVYVTLPEHANTIYTCDTIRTSEENINTEEFIELCGEASRVCYNFGNFNQKCLYVVQYDNLTPEIIERAKIEPNRAEYVARLAPTINPWGREIPKDWKYI